VAHTSTRGSLSGIYRRSADGIGAEELLFQYTPGAALVLTQWSADGRFMTFHDGCAGVLHVLPLDERPEGGGRRAIEWLRDEYSVAQARISPDSKMVAYLSDEIEAEKWQVYVRRFDPTKSDVSTDGTKPIQVSSQEVQGMVSWRQDGRELYYITSDWKVMAAEVIAGQTIRVGAPRVLFTVPGPYPLVGVPFQWNNVSADGRRFVFVINVPASSSRSDTRR
jgi:Tol biopolymer transport system component